jgi:hypothetical protein
LEGSFQGYVLEAAHIDHGYVGNKTQGIPNDGGYVKCTSFDWISSWTPTAEKIHGGRAP